jgi:hypothetical protein
MNENKGILSGGWSMVMRNKRYIFWFWLLNLVLAAFGVSAFSEQAHHVLDNSLYSGKLMHTFNISVFAEMLSRPEFGPTSAAGWSAFGFSVLFFVFTALFLPGVFLGYSSPYRLPREDFFRACGRNLWRFIRLLFVSGIIMGIVAGLLFTLHGVIEKKAGDSTNELLVPEVQLIGLIVIFLVMATLRIWFDLAEADIVLNDQRAVRKSISAGFRHTWRSLGRLLTSYVVTTILAAIILVAGILIWQSWVQPGSTVSAFLVSQLTLFLLLVPRFWQRGIAVSYWQQKMLAPVVQTVPVITPIAPVVTLAPAPIVVIPPSPAPEGA